MFLKSKPISQLQRKQLKPLLDRQVHLEELIIDETPKGGHLIFAHHLRKTCHFYIFDNSNENILKELNNSVWKSIK